MPRRVSSGVRTAALLMAACAASALLWGGGVGGQADGLQLPPETPFPAEDGCPCLTSEEVAARIMPAANYSASGFCPDGTFAAVVTSEASQALQCLTDAIGSGSCRAWGQITMVCEVHKQVSYYEGSKGLDVGEADVAKWCNQGWCYVDPKACVCPVKRSSLFPSADLWYSYETCGYVDTYGPRLLDQKLSSVSMQSLRYTFPGDDGFRIWRTDTGEVTGSFPAIFEKVKDMFASADRVVFTEVEISDKAMGAVWEMFGQTSSYTACAAMLAFNQTDICIAPHWSSPERHAMAQYIFSWSGDQMYLMSYTSELQGGDLLAGIFLPFKAEVWMVFALTMLVTIVLFGIIEVSPRIAATFVPSDDAELLWAERLHRHLIFASRVILLSVEGVLDFHPEGYNPLSVAGRLLKAAWLLFMVIFMATYTANLAAILGGQSPTQYTSITDAINKKASICVPSVIMTQLTELVPGLSALAVDLPFIDVFEAMDAGTCDAGIWYDAAYDIRPQQHCNKVAVGLPVTSLPVSLLSRSFIAQHLNLAVDSLFFSGATQAITNEYIQRYKEDVVGSAECQAGASDSTSNQLNLINMSSLFILFTLAALVAVFCDIMERICPWLITRSRAIPFQVAGDGGPGHLYLRDDYKDTYSISLPPGLRVSRPSAKANRRSSRTAHVNGGSKSSLALTSLAPDTEPSSPVAGHSSNHEAGNLTFASHEERII